MDDQTELKSLLDQIADQQLQIALVFEKILGQMEAPQPEGMAKTLEKLLAPLVQSAEEIKTNLGI